jgi:signal transduction histidine kinase
MAGRRDRKDVLLEAGLALASELSLPIVLQRIVDVATQVTDARYGALGVIGESGELIEFVTTGIPEKQRRLIGPLPRGRGVLGLLIREPTAVRIKNIADHPASVGFPPHHPPMHSFLGAPVQAMGHVYGNIYLAEKRSGAEFSLEDQESVVVLATQAGLAIANASLYEEARLRERLLDAVRAITVDILAGAEAQVVLEHIAERACHLAAADAAIIVTSNTPDQLVISAAVGQRAAELHGQVVPARGSISGEVMRTGKALVVDDASTDRRAHQPTVALSRHGPAIFVPLRVRGSVTGTLTVANLKGGRRFDNRTLQLVETFADQASVAIEYGRAQADLRRLGLMDERERIAKELHDGIIQSLFAVGMGLEATALLSRSPDIATRLESSVGELDRVIRDLRNYIFGLRPGILADRQLDQALRTLADEIQSRSTLRVEVDVDASLAAELSGRSHEIVQLTREALSNVSRHAQANHAAVKLARSGSDAVLSIQDDGVGFDVNGHSAGFGLRNMQERAATLGGVMDVRSAAANGTTLRVTFPA